jgi:hypothetical protein
VKQPLSNVVSAGCATIREAATKQLNRRQPLSVKQPLSNVASAACAAIREAVVKSV